MTSLWEAKEGDIPFFHLRISFFSAASSWGVESPREGFSKALLLHLALCMPPKPEVDSTRVPKPASHSLGPAVIRDLDGLFAFLLTR